MLFSVWAATTRNKDWIRMAGMKRVIDSSSHRQEVVAGNMAEYLATRESVSPVPPCLVTVITCRGRCRIS